MGDYWSFAFFEKQHMKPLMNADFLYLLSHLRRQGRPTIHECGDKNRRSTNKRMPLFVALFVMDRHFLARAFR